MDNTDVPKGVYIRASAVRFVTRDRLRKTLKAKIKKKEENLTYLQHPVRKIHQLPLVLGNLCHGGRLVFLELTDVTGDDLK